MKILFFAKGQESISIEYLSAALKKKGHIVDLAFDPGIDDILGFMDIGFLKVRRNVWFLKKIEEFCPDLICFSCLTNLYGFVKEKASVIKKHYDIPIAVGGIHPTILPDHVIKNPDIDMICLGEGDEALVELADKMDNKIDYYDTQNFWFKKNGAVIRNPLRPLLQDLDSLPFPDRELFYQYGCFAGTFYLISGRGCPFTCSYCCHHFLQNIYRGKGKYVRRRSVDNIIQEIELCSEKYKIKSVYSMDDTFTIDNDWIEEFSIKYRQKIDLPLYCHVRPGTVTQRMIASLKRANCGAVFFGVDSGNENMRYNIMNRKIKNSVIIEQAKLLRDSGIKITTSAIFGLPDETEQQMYDTMNLCKAIKSDLSYSFIFYPFPNTDSYNYCIKNNLLSQADNEKIMNGDGSFHKTSLIKQANADLAEILKNLLPLSIKFPRFSYFIDIIIKKRCKRLSRLIFLITVPITYSSYGRNKIREIASIAIQNWKMLNIFYKE
jgi:radical SAM superfamily enzyme YgiQ (UPF0313 family)